MQQGPTLKQGSQMDGVGDSSKKSSEEEVMVSQFKLSDKQKLIKESFAKRYYFYFNSSVEYIQMIF